MKASQVPSFFLYGEAPRAVTARFVHLETLDDRSRPADWIIRPHAHANLNHVLLVSAGAGTAHVEAQSFAFAGPTLLVVPAATIHGFRFEQETRGHILTVADAYLEDLFRKDADLRLVKAFAMAPLPGDGLLEADLRRLQAELSWRALGHAAALEGRLLTLLVEVIRVVQRSGTFDPARLGPHAVLLARFRALVEDHFRDGWSIDAYASALNTTVGRLRSACRGASTSPLRLLQERIALESKRMLVYSDLTVAEVAFSLGFHDPAYFSRLFARWVGRPPLAYRLWTTSGANGERP